MLRLAARAGEHTTTSSARASASASRWPEAFASSGRGERREEPVVRDVVERPPAGLPDQGRKGHVVDPEDWGREARIGERRAARPAAAGRPRGGPVRRGKSFRGRTAMSRPRQLVDERAEVGPRPAPTRRRDVRGRLDEEHAEIGVTSRADQRRRTGSAARSRPRARGSRQQAREVGGFASALALGPVGACSARWVSDGWLAITSGRLGFSLGSPCQDYEPPARARVEDVDSIEPFRPPHPRPRPGLSLRDQARLGLLVDESRFTPQDAVVLGDE